MKNISMFLTTFIFFISGVQADVSIDPVQMYILNDAKQKTTTLTLESINETEKKLFEVKAFKWDQNKKGEDVLEPEDALIINPRSFILQPNGKQVIRIGFNRPTQSILAGKQEGTWRILVEEIPQTVKESSITFLLNFNLPLFIGKQDDIKLKFNIENDKLIVLNKANSHIQIANLKIIDSNKKEIFKSDTLGYALANKSLSYDLKGLKIQDLNKYYVKLQTDKSNEMVELKFME